MGSVFGLGMHSLFACFNSMSSSYQANRIDLDQEHQMVQGDRWLKLSPHRKLGVVEYILSNPDLCRKHIRISNKGVRQLSELKKSNPLKNYTQIRYIGSGVYGDVSLYKHHRDSKTYAVKTCFTSFSTDLAPTFNEILIAVALSNQNELVRVKKILMNPESKQVHIVMELLETPTFKERSRFEFKFPKMRLSFPRYGIILQDRHSGNFGIRMEGKRRKPVHIDFGLSTINKDRLLTQLKNEIGPQPNRPGGGRRA